MARRDRGRHAPDRVRRLVPVALVAALVVPLAGVAGVLLLSRDPEALTVEARQDGSGLAFGVLGSRCDPDRVDALHQAGVRYAEVGLSWASFEPVPGEYDPGYAAYVSRLIDQCERAGIRVVLTPGLHSAPGWVADLPGGAYLDQHGGRGPEEVPNVVFSAAVRDAVGDYLAGLDRAVGLGRAAAIRVGTGTNGELGYPATASAGPNPFWAFDVAAQEGLGLADGAAATPLPGWSPGSTRNGSPVPVEQVRTWFEWYSRSVADAVIWVVGTLRDQGFEGDIHLPLAGRGALPADLEMALAAGLDGTADRDGSLEGGLFYPQQLPYIADALARDAQPGWGEVLADSSSVDDATAVTARQLDPPQDSCRPGDAALDLLSEPHAEQWSSVRWTVANARRAGLGVMGENPGSPDTPGTGGNELTDSSAEQLVHAPRYARECGMSLFMWAFEDDLFSTRPDAGIADYAAQIRIAGKGRRRPADGARRRGAHR